MIDGARWKAVDKQKETVTKTLERSSNEERAVHSRRCGTCQSARALEMHNTIQTDHGDRHSALRRCLVKVVTDNRRSQTAYPSAPSLMLIKAEVPKSVSVYCEYGEVSEALRLLQNRRHGRVSTKTRGGLRCEFANINQHGLDAIHLARRAGRGLRQAPQSCDLGLVTVGVRLRGMVWRCLRRCHCAGVIMETSLKRLPRLCWKTS